MKYANDIISAAKETLNSQYNKIIENDVIENYETQIYNKRNDSINTSYISAEKNFNVNAKVKGFFNDNE